MAQLKDTLVNGDITLNGEILNVYNSAYIDELNNPDITTTTCNIRIQRYLNIVNIRINIRGIVTVSSSNQWIELITLPSIYRPTGMSIIHNYVTQSSIPMILQIGEDGLVQIYSTQTGTLNTWLCRQCITYIV